MEQRHSWEANSSSASVEISRILWNMKIHERVYKSPPLVFIVSQINPVQAILSYLFKIHFITPLPSTSRLSNWLLSFRLPSTSCIHFSSPYACHIPHPSHPPSGRKYPFTVVLLPNLIAQNKQARIFIVHWNINVITRNTCLSTY
jgi:hypothetical protein